MSKHFFVEDDVEARDSLKSKEKDLRIVVGEVWSVLREFRDFRERVRLKLDYYDKKEERIRKKLLKFREESK